MILPSSHSPSVIKPSQAMRAALSERPYFKEREITLSEMKATDIQAFYMKQLKRVKANSVIHYHAVIHRALKYAVKIDLISVNPADKVERPKADKFIGSFYDSNEVQALFEAAKGTLIEIPIFLGAFYGLRRSEALGLKWDAIDFQNNTITIRHTVTSCNLDGKHIQIAQDTTKNQVEYENTAPCSCVQREAAKAQGTAGRIQTSMRTMLQQKVFGVYLRR